MEAFAKRKKEEKKEMMEQLERKRDRKRGADGARIELETGREEGGFENVRERTRGGDFGQIVEE